MKEAGEAREQAKSELLVLLNKHPSKAHMKMICGLLMKDERLLPLIFEIINQGDAQSAMRAAWLLSNLYDLESEALLPYQQQMIQAVLATESDSVRRSLLRIIESGKLSDEDDDEQLGKLFDACLRWMVSESHAIAVRCNAMQVLYRICLIEPELAPEVILNIETLLAHGSAGFKSRGSKIMAALRKSDQANRRKEQAGECSPKQNHQK